jgi:hypothetical protein
MLGVRGDEPGLPVEQWPDDTGRVAILVLNEGGLAGVYVDLIDVVEWLASISPEAINVGHINSAISAKKHLGGHK